MICIEVVTKKAINIYKPNSEGFRLMRMSSIYGFITFILCLIVIIGISCISETA